MHATVAHTAQRPAQLPGIFRGARQHKVLGQGMAALATATATTAALASIAVTALCAGVAALLLGCRGAPRHADALQRGNEHGDCDL